MELQPAKVHKEGKNRNLKPWPILAEHHPRLKPRISYHSPAFQLRSHCLHKSLGQSILLVTRKTRKIEKLTTDDGTPIADKDHESNQRFLYEAWKSKSSRAGRYRFRA